MKAERFTASGLWVERQQRKGEPITYVAWKPCISQGFNEPADLLRWVKWPAGTPTGDALRGWLKDAGLEEGREPNDNTKAII